MMSDPKIDPERMKKWEANILPVPSAELLKGRGSSPSDLSTDLFSLADRWERISKSWKQVASDRAEDAPDIADRAQVRATAYLDCAEELRVKANAQAQPHQTGASDD